MTPIDSNLLLKLISGNIAETEEKLFPGDMNGDGTISPIDANMLKKTIAGVRV